MEIRLNNSYNILNIRNCNLIKCEISSSSLYSYGGALYLRLSNGSQSSISNSTFKEC